jgi:hypothetical protein
VPVSRLAKAGFQGSKSRFSREQKPVFKGAKAGFQGNKSRFLKLNSTGFREKKILRTAKNVPKTLFFEI